MKPHSRLIPISIPLLLLSLTTLVDAQLGIGINYGQIANNLPNPTQVAALLRSININRVKLYDADPNVLSAFAGTSVDFTIALGNEHLPNMTSLPKALLWIRTHVLPFISRTRISSITVGNEVFATTTNAALFPLLLPAMQNVHAALSALGLSDQVAVTSAHAIKFLATSYPPSSGSFRPELAPYIQPILAFHATTKTPFLINAYPFFAYMADPDRISIDYAVFRPNSGMTDPYTNLYYDNMLYAQIDAVYFAIKALGHTDIEVRVSETGWPSRGDPDEYGATPENAAAYNGNLLRRIQRREATPAKPSVAVDVYLFALFNENLKPGPSSERNYGLYYPDGTPVYNIGLRGYLPTSTTTYYTSSAHRSFTDLYIHIVWSWMTITKLRSWLRTL